VLLIEDGSDLGHCNCIKVNVPRFLEKYDFETQKNELDRVEKYYLTLTQQDFERRSLLEMLDYATLKMQPNINKAKHYYKYCFDFSGKPITSLRQISPDTKAVIVSDKAQFKGVYSSSKIVSFEDHVNRQEIKGRQQIKM
jgi:hypothetical protein